MGVYRYNKLKQGKFKPKNPHKYSGDVDNIWYRSGLEHRYFRYFDLNPSVIKWSSEEVKVYYVGLDGKQHRYFLDAYLKIRNKNDEIKEILVEIKPSSMIVPPNEQQRKTKQWKEKFANFLTIKAKQEAAEKFCKKMGWQFMFLTENDLKR